MASNTECSRSATNQESDRENSFKIVPERKLEKYRCAEGIIGTLILHYLDPSPEDVINFVGKISPKSDATCNQGPLALYKRAHDFLVTELAQRKISCQPLLGILNFLQGKLPDGNNNDISDPAILRLYENWNGAIFNFATEGMNEQNEKELISYLESSLCFEITKYQIIKPLLIFDINFINQLKKLAETSAIAKMS